MRYYTTASASYECRMRNCGMENYLRNFGVDVDVVDFCDECPFMDAINKLAEYEEREARDRAFYKDDIFFEHG